MSEKTNRVETDRDQKWNNEFNDERRFSFYDETIDIISLRRKERFKVIENLMGSVEKRKNDSINILELGTGTGILTEKIISKFSRSLICGVDGSEGMLKIAKDKESIKNFKNINFINADFTYSSWINHLPQDIKFDLIVTTDSLHHLSHKRKYDLYKEIYELLSEDGEFIISDHMTSVDNYYQDKMFGLWIEDLVKNLKDIENDKTISNVFERTFGLTTSSYKNLTLDDLKKCLMDILDKEGENPLPIKKHQDYMMKIGFNNVEVQYRFSSFSIITASKASYV